jgi:hypothetical protein
MNFENEFEKLVETLRKNFIECKIYDFLNTHLRMSQLFTAKLQFVIDNKQNLTHEIRFDIPPDIIKKIDDFNNNINNLVKSELKPEILSGKPVITDLSNDFPDKKPDEAKA